MFNISARRKASRIIWASVRWYAASVFLLLPSSSHALAAAPSTELTSEQLFARVSPAVVKVHVYGPDSKLKAQGSGFFVSTDGLVITNYHVMAGAASAKLVLNDGKVVEVSGIAASIPSKDLILLKADVPKAEFLQISKGQPKVGARVFAVGSPQGLTNTISEGLISGDRKLSEGFSLLQTTAAISPGSSGGPLLTNAGEVAGVTTAAWRGGQNLNFAVPSTYLGDLLKAASTPVALSSISLPEAKRRDAEENDAFPSFEALLLTTPEKILPMKVSSDKKHIISLEWTPLRCSAFTVWASTHFVRDRIALRIEDSKLDINHLRSRPGFVRLFFNVQSDSKPVPSRYQIDTRLTADSASELATVSSGKKVVLHGQIDSLRIGMRDSRPEASGLVRPDRIAVIMDLSNVVVVPLVQTTASPSDEIAKSDTPADPEVLASRHLSLARTYISNGVEKKAREILVDIVTQWPKSKAAIEAKRILEDLTAGKK